MKNLFTNNNVAANNSNNSKLVRGKRAAIASRTLDKAFFIGDADVMIAKVLNKDTNL